MLAGTGCQSGKLQLTAEQEQVKAQLCGIAPARSSLARSTRIIDVHTHTFNARYLPLEGVLLGKRDAAPPLSWLISDRCAQTLAQALIDRTELAPAAQQPRVERRVESHAHSPNDGGFVCGVFLKLLDKAAAAGSWDKNLSSKAQQQRLNEVADSMNLQERMAVTAATRMMGLEERLETDDRRGALRGAVHFLWLLTQNDAEMARLFRMEHDGVPMRGPPFMVSHMMDLAPVYNQTEDGVSLLNVARQQVRRMAEFQARPGSGMAYFAAYNPYRDHWKGGRPGDALRIVQAAIQKHDAWGVKVYPPSGYRAAGNAVKARPSGVRSKFASQQWSARYPGSTSEASSALDQRLEELLRWCIANDVPVFAHSGTGEFEPRKGYGVYHSDPRFWRRFLENNPGPNGSPCRLRLALGHAGGGDFWFGGGKYSSWGQEVYELCRDYPNVYCEVTAHAELVDPDKQAYFVEKLARCFSGAADARPNTGRRRYPFSKKLMYGTDWYLPDSRSRRDILLATQQALLHPKLRDHYNDYFFGNAVRYLKAQRIFDPDRAPVRKGLRDRHLIGKKTRGEALNPELGK